MSQLAGQRMWEDHDGIQSHIELDQPERRGRLILLVGDARTCRVLIDRNKEALHGPVEAFLLYLFLSITVKAEKGSYAAPDPASVFTLFGRMSPVVTCPMSSTSRRS